jgi:hypothetical protein
MAVGHGAAARRHHAPRYLHNYGTEGNPLLRPFSHSKAIYAATQVSPAVMDYVGRRMMTIAIPRFANLVGSSSAGAGFSFGAGMHNYSLTQ